MSDTHELYYAEMEAARNDAEHAYFMHREDDDTPQTRRTFRAGYERAFSKLWNTLSAEARGNTDSVAGREKPQGEPARPEEKDGLPPDCVTRDRLSVSNNRHSQETSAVRPDSCHCPSVPGEDCKLTAAECERRTQMNR